MAIHEEFGTQPFPRIILIAAAALLAFVLVVVAVARITSSGHKVNLAAPVSTRDLLFADGPEGSVLITDVNGALVERLESGTNGFVRGVMRSFARERRSHGLDSSKPFRMTSRVDGSLTLEDTATGRLIDLGSFGTTNADTFASLLQKTNRTVASGADT